MDRLLSKYDTKIRQVVYHVAYDAKAYEANKAAFCAGEQGQYWAFRKLLFARQAQWARLSIGEMPFRDYAQELRLDVKGFGACYDSDRFKGRLSKEMQLAHANNVSSTPTITINDQRFVGVRPFEEYDAAVARELSK